MSVLSLGKSIHHFISSSSLRMINSLHSSSSLNWNAPLPSRMEVNSGKSTHHLLFNPFTFKHHTRTIRKGAFTKEECFQTGQVYSSFSFKSNHSQTRHESISQKSNCQTGVISNWASLIIISFFQNHSSTPMKHT